MSRALIVGAGLIGLLTARALRARGFDVTVIDRAEAGREASWAGGGILSPLYPWRFPDAVTALARWSQARWPALAAELAARTGIDPECRRTGMLVIDADDPDEVAAWAVRHDVRIVHHRRAALAALEPAVAATPGHLYELPGIDQVRNPRLLRALIATAVGEGVELRTGIGVERVALRGGAVAGVDTDQGRLAAEHVIVCAGPWSGRLLAAGAIDSPPIRPVRGQMLAFAGRGDLLERVVLSGGRYLIPRADGTILAGSTLEDAGFERATTGAARAQLHAFARGLLPALAEAPVTAHWAGLRPGSADGVPTIAGHPGIAGLWLNAGHYRNGIVTAPASAELLAALVAGAAPAFDPLPYAWPSAAA